jgi:primosomal protein N'
LWRKFAELAHGEYPDLLCACWTCESQINRVAGKYRWRMAVKCSYNARLRALLWRVWNGIMRRMFIRMSLSSSTPSMKIQFNCLKLRIFLECF